MQYTKNNDSCRQPERYLHPSRTKPRKYFLSADETTQTVKHPITLRLRSSRANLHAQPSYFGSMNDTAHLRLQRCCLGASDHYRPNAHNPPNSDILVAPRDNPILRRRVSVIRIIMRRRLAPSHNCGRVGRVPPHILTSKTPVIRTVTRNRLVTLQRTQLIIRGVEAGSKDRHP